MNTEDKKKFQQSMKTIASLPPLVNPLAFRDVVGKGDAHLDGLVGKITTQVDDLAKSQAELIAYAKSRLET